MTSFELGTSTSSAEVTNISRHGFWILVQEQEHFLPFESFPWFREARLSEILDVQLLHGFHLYWPKLDVDLELAALEHPEQFPLLDTGGLP